LPLDRTTARHGLPHPLALLYDRLNQHDPRSKLTELLRFAEGTAHFLAWVLVAEAAARGIPPKQLRAHIKPGAGFGFFLYVIESTIRERRAQPNGFLRALDGFLDDPAWMALQAFNELRNDVAHNRLSSSSETARAVLAEHRDLFQQLLDGVAFFTRHPLGVLRGTRVALDGVVTAHWFACRGLSLHSGNVEIADAAQLPSEQLLLIDPGAGLALTLAPFFLCTEQAFCWLDLPNPHDTSPRSVYVRPLSGDPLPAGTPTGVFDATGASPSGLSLDAWLADPRQRGRLIPLRLDAPSLRAIVQSAAPTQAFEVQPGPAAWVISPEAPVASAAERATVAAQPTAPVPWAPTMLMNSVPVPLTSVESVAPVASERALPVTVTPLWRGRPLIVGATIGTLLVGTFLARAHSTGTPMREPTAGPLAQASTPSASTPPVPTPLPSNPSLQQWVQAWLPGPDRLDDAQLARYADRVAFQGMSRDPGPSFILGRWRERLQAGTFTVDLARSTWYETVETDGNVPTACRDLPGADPGVTVARLEADEDGAPQGLAFAASGVCSRVRGTYLLRSRIVAGRRLICHETWHQEAVCRSCPGFSNCPRGR
jgi:hypothetical protein